MQFEFRRRIFSEGYINRDQRRPMGVHGSYYLKNSNWWFQERWVQWVRRNCSRLIVWSFKSFATVGWGHERHRTSNKNWKTHTNVTGCISIVVFFSFFIFFFCFFFDVAIVANKVIIAIQQLSLSLFGMRTSHCSNSKKSWVRTYSVWVSKLLFNKDHSRSLL